MVVMDGRLKCRLLVVGHDSEELGFVYLAIHVKVKLFDHRLPV